MLGLTEKYVAESGLSVCGPALCTRPMLGANEAAH